MAQLLPNFVCQSGLQGESMAKSLQNILFAGSVLALFTTAAEASPIIAGNSAAFGSGPIGTFDFGTGLPVGSFIPQGSVDCPGGSCNGRGLALTLDRFFYTELSGGFGATDSIRIAPYNGGLGGPDIGFFPNPVPNNGIQALAFGAAGLYVLTGYPASPSTVFILDGVTGAPVGGPIVLAGANSGMDGFTVMPDGTFVGNLGDAVNLYTHWAADGTNLGGNFQAEISPGNACGTATGIEIAPDGNSFYVMCNFNAYVQTDLDGDFIASISAPGGAWEDIAIQQPFDCTGRECVPDDEVPVPVPEPATLALFGSGVIGLAAVLRRRRRARA